MKQAREEDIAQRVEQIQRVRSERQKDAKEQRRRKQQKETEEHALRVKIRQEAQVPQPPSPICCPDGAHSLTTAMCLDDNRNLIKSLVTRHSRASVHPR